jgi:hypothetical protein
MASPAPTDSKLLSAALGSRASDALFAAASVEIKIIVVSRVSGGAPPSRGDSQQFVLAGLPSRLAPGAAAAQRAPPWGDPTVPDASDLEAASLCGTGVAGAWVRLEPASVAGPSLRP